MMTGQATRIAELNDRFRKGDPAIPGKTMLTIGVQGLTGGDPHSSTALLKAVHSFDSFTPDNDPHGEHDFGSLEFGGEKLFWKIDYFDPGLEFGSEDPADIAQTVRVLTIMLAEEY